MLLKVGLEISESKEIEVKMDSYWLGKISVYNPFHKNNKNKLANKQANKQKSIKANKKKEKKNQAYIRIVFRPRRLLTS